MPDYADSNYRIDGVEIFAIGTHNGDEYTDLDLQAMLDSYGALDYKPPLKAGHVQDKKGMPALGWVDNLRRVGNKLVADFTGLPKLVYEAIRDKRYNTVSSEVYWNLERGGKKFYRALKAVALLGAEIPAVAGLKPLHEMFDDADQDVRIVEYTQSDDGVMFFRNRLYHLYAMNLHGIPWGQPGAFAECVSRVGDQMSDPKAFCASLEHKVTGHWPGEKKMSATVKENPMTPEEVKELNDKMAAHEKAVADEKAAREAQEKKYEEEKAAMKKEYADGLATMEKKFSDMLKGSSADELSELLSNIEDHTTQDKVRELSQQTAIAKRRAEDAEKRAAELDAEREAKDVKITKLEEEKRQRNIDAISQSCRIPGVRTFVSQFLDLATRQPEVKVYDAAGQKVSASKAAEDYIKYVNENAVRIFSVVSGEDPATKNEANVNDEVDKRTRKFMRDQKETDYAKAMRAVLNDDPALKHQYAVSSRNQA
jgi:hypothetical protein